MPGRRAASRVAVVPAGSAVAAIGAALLGRDDVGRLRSGARADVVVVDDALALTTTLLSGILVDAIPVDAIPLETEGL
jgi:N-acetylglucosamine-6-phosphate deacetylase